MRFCSMVLTATESDGGETLQQAGTTRIVFLMRPDLVLGGHRKFIHTRHARGAQDTLGLRWHERRVMSRLACRDLLGLRSLRRCAG